MNKQLNISTEQMQEDFTYFTEWFQDLFPRKESRAQSTKYLKSLMAPVERKNGWQMAEYIGDEIPDSMQRLLFRMQWNEDAVRDELQDFIVEKFGDRHGIGVLDETGFLKKGDRSAGVQRQYSGTAGKVENCQIGTFLIYATKIAHTFLDRRLFLPQAWCKDMSRRKRAKIPEEIEFRTKPEQAMEMLRHAWERGVPMQWVAGDSVYGNSPGLRNMINLAGKYYIMGVSSKITVWKKWPEALPRENKIRGKGKGKPKYPQPVAVDAVIDSLNARRWKRFSVGDGEKGSRVYDWTRIRVVENEDGYPTRQAWLVARRSVNDPSDIAYYLSNASEETSMLKLAEIAATRYKIEQCFEEAKGETGLDHYEVRHWQSWNRHITLSMMAHAFLAWVRLKSGGKKKLLMMSWLKYPYPKCAN